MDDGSIRTKTLVVRIQENGIIRDEANGQIIARLLETLDGSIDFSDVSSSEVSYSGLKRRSS